MALIKICPTCGSQNRVDEMMCQHCLGDISGVRPVDADIPPVHQKTVDDKTTSQQEAMLLLRTKGGEEIRVKSGDVLGRHIAGGDFLSNHQTVSRRHVRFICENRKWFVEDLGSTNGTYIDGVRIPSAKLCELRNGQTLGLSSSVSMVVIATK